MALATPNRSDIIQQVYSPDVMVCPMCCSCKVPVERFHMDPLSSRFFLRIWAECHGKTEYKEVPTEQAIRAKHVAFFRKDAFNSLNVRKVVK